MTKRVKKVTMTLGKMVSIMQTLNILCGDVNMTFPGKISYALYKNRAALADDFEYYNTERERIVSSCAEKNDSGYVMNEDQSGVIIRDDKKQEFLNKMSELNSQEIEVEFNSLNLDYFLERDDMKPIYFQALEMMCE